MSLTDEQKRERARLRDENGDAIRDYQRRYYRENRESIREKQRSRNARQREQDAATKRLSNYGLTQSEFDRLLGEQEGRCAICRQPPPDGRWVVDHDHDCCPGRKSCGKCVRGLLCSPCNLGIGLLGENWETLLAGAFYLMEGEERRLCRPADDLEAVCDGRA